MVRIHLSQLMAVRRRIKTARWKAQVKARQDRVRRAYQAYKESRPCVDCNEFYPYCVMQFDHINSDKKYTLAQRSASFGSDWFAEELTKCEPVCANCHAIRTWKRKTGLLV